MFESGGDIAALQRARHVLDLAERRTGVLSRRESSVALPPAGEDLADVLPQGALPRGAVVAILGSTGLLTQVVGATQTAGWVAIVGWPELGALRMAEAGVDLERTMLVPKVRGTVAAVAALLDGFDQVVVGPHVELTAGERRQLLARARRNDSTLLTRKAWQGTALQLRTVSVHWSGPASGGGWLRRVQYVVARTSRWDAQERPFEITFEWPSDILDGPSRATTRVQEMAAVPDVRTG